ncbi:hypothetical protein DFQ14_11925 [Halopolyspora algeriensis]|uniref:Uncharacterized protein n=2 Tax=Halopolyspora algeriensis TaxID=1500506 RepID=A0A368VII8_9ACTN|nr:hypothetical protein DFQ14_11925 [Halopolyspora algeriensis]TQM46668.1 hypothetical protein FHU43_3788 [Halopolyspora algeriensis]
MNDWKRVAAYAGSYNWRDFADWAIEQVLIAPYATNYSATHDMWNYRAPLVIRDNNGNVIKRYRPLVAVANADSNIITAFPRR